AASDRGQLHDVRHGSTADPLPHGSGDPCRPRHPPHQITRRGASPAPLPIPPPNQDCAGSAGARTRARYAVSSPPHSYVRQALGPPRVTGLVSQGVTSVVTDEACSLVVLVQLVVLERLGPISGCVVGAPILLPPAAGDAMPETFPSILCADDDLEVLE